MSKLNDFEVIEISGASVGGVSYAHRILKALKIAIVNGHRVKVIIGKGKKSHQVYAKVLEGVQDLKAFATMVGGERNRVNVTIEMR